MLTLRYVVRGGKGEGGGVGQTYKGRIDEINPSLYFLTF